MRTLHFVCGGHCYIYRYWVGCEGDCLKRVYLDSRRGENGFSLAKVFEAIQILG